MSHLITFISKDTACTPDVLKPLVPMADWQNPLQDSENLYRVRVQDPCSLEQMQHLRKELSPHRIDVFQTKKRDTSYRLLIADMDSTIVKGETLDDLAAFAGIKEKIAAITARAMNGELDFEAALNERVGLLKGLPQDALDKTVAEVCLNSGALAFIRGLKEQGIYCVLVSGGFTVFTGDVAARCGFDAHHGNTLELAGGVLTGCVIPPILDKHAKVAFMEQYREQLGIEAADVIAIGDGANDLPMLQKAGLGIGYYAKSNVAAHLENVIQHGDLQTALRIIA